MLYPDHGDPLPPRLLDEAAYICDDRVALVSPRDDAVLHVNDDEGGVRSLLECRHSLPPRMAFPVMPRYSSERAASAHGVDRRFELAVRPYSAALSAVSVVPCEPVSQPFLASDLTAWT